MKQVDLDFLSKVLKNHLKSNENTAFVFGSRVNNSNQRFSDFDIGIEGKKIPAQTFLK